ncbi:hypothetical protein [Fulvimonas yonginensis]|uniref:hypothetical protein n=1 Tax=Fulvimonas yonginensis TaxID=1495200 RepID=UPI003018F0D2
MSLDPARPAPPSPLCQAGATAPVVSARAGQDLQYSGTTDPVSVVRQPGRDGAPDVWRVTF